MKELNRQTQTLAPVYCLGRGVAGATASNDTVDLACLNHEGWTYLVAVNTKDSPADCKISLPPELAKAEIRGEELFGGEAMAISGGIIPAHFDSYQVRVYKFKDAEQ